MNIVMPYYENPGMLARHMANFRRLPGARIVIVDDGSPRHPAEGVIRAQGPTGLDLRLFRIDVDIPWNQPGARNLGMLNVQGWTLLTDMDRLIEPHEWWHLLGQRLQATEFYALNDRTCGPHYAPGGTHPGTFVILPELYWAAGGFNEDFSGHYAYDDIAFRKVARRMARERLLPVFVTVYTSADIRDAKTHDYGRHDCPAASRNVPALMELVKSPRQAENPIRFPWHEVNLAKNAP